MWDDGRTLRWGLPALLVLAAAWSLVEGPPAAPADPADAGTRPSAVVDDRGRRVPLDGSHRRVVSLVPALTEALLELGLGPRLVARTEHDRNPALRSLPSVGSPTTPSLEVLLASAPDLVVTWADEGHPRVPRRLRERGVAVYGARLTTFDELRRHVRALGLLTGRTAAADSLVSAFDRRMEAASGPPPHGRRPSVALPIWPEPLSVAGPATFVDALIRRAGAANAFGDLRRPWPVIDPETLAARDPDVLVLPEPARGPSPWRLAGPPWSSLSAVRGDRVIRLPRDLVERPTLRSARAVRTLRRALLRLSPPRERRP